MPETHHHIFIFEETTFEVGFFEEGPRVLLYDACMLWPFYLPFMGRDDRPRRYDESYVGIDEVIRYAEDSFKQPELSDEALAKIRKALILYRKLEATVAAFLAS